MLRAERIRHIDVGIVGAGRIAKRFVSESRYVSSVNISGVYDVNNDNAVKLASGTCIKTYRDYSSLLNDVDAVNIASPHMSHYQLAKEALEAGKHVLVETPFALDDQEARDLFAIAEDSGLIATEASKTAHCPAFTHLMSMIKRGVIGDVVDIDVSLSKLLSDKVLKEFDPN